MSLRLLTHMPVCMSYVRKSKAVRKKFRKKRKKPAWLHEPVRSHSLRVIFSCPGALSCPVDSSGRGPVQGARSGPATGGWGKPHRTSGRCWSVWHHRTSDSHGVSSRVRGGAAGSTTGRPSCARLENFNRNDRVIVDDVNRRAGARPGYSDPRSLSVWTASSPI